MTNARAKRLPAVERFIWTDDDAEAIEKHNAAAAGDEVARAIAEAVARRAAEQRAATKGD